MKFSEVRLGTRAERPITFEWHGESCSCAQRPLTGEEEGLALSRATDYAKEQRAVEAKPGNPLFDVGYMANVLALSTIDVDSPAAARELYFKDAAEVLGKLDCELMQFLFARHEAWQQECSPTRAKLPGDQLIATLIRIVEGEDDLPFAQLRPGAQLSLLRTTGALLLNSPEARSRLFSLFGTTTTSPRPMDPSPS